MYQDLQNVVLCPLAREYPFGGQVLLILQNLELKEQETQCPSVAPWK